MIMYTYLNKLIFGRDSDNYNLAIADSDEFAISGKNHINKFLTFI